MAKTAAIQALASVASIAIASPIIDPRQDDRFTFYSLETPLSGPCDLSVGPDGALWGESILVNQIFRIDPSSGDVEEYSIPFTTPLSNKTILGVSSQIQDRTAFSCAIREGRDGNLYASNGLRNQLVRINPSTKDIKVFEIEPLNPLGDLQPFNDLYSAANGIYVTQTTGNALSFFNFSSETFTTYAVPTPLSLPLGLFVASNGIVYIAEMLSNKILTFDPTTKAMNEYALPELAQFPTVIRAEKDGYVYFALFTGNGIGRINMQSHDIEIYHTDELGGIGAEDTIDQHGGVWYSFFDVDALARLNTTTLDFSYVSFPGTGNDLGLDGGLGDVPPFVDVAVNYGPGDAIYFTDIQGNRVGRYDISGLY
ncbi:NHL repeat-containing protein [Teratosphaeria nubilosa]|uniref:NHL repeat-containing protein n=1 Tax=Teratosphaeria nubilosa TaxID=161662 RepID=A0A6G1LHS9_9PEZI|nr:NHL repeat-containing protein [Teratosphaeria nubilosa]